MTVEQLLGARIRECSEFACAMWSALADVERRHENGDTAEYTFRAAGDMIAAIRGCGDYMDWYCCGPYATVTDEIRIALSAQGWSPTFPYSDVSRL